jgi:phytoene synthase
VTAPSARRLDEAYAWCREITRRRARNFYYGLRLTPEPQRSALYTLYAWTRHADDIVDGGREGDEGRLQQVRDFLAATDQTLDGELPEDTHLWVALRDIAGRYPLAREDFHAMIDGQLEDLAEHVHYETFDDLRLFCYRVASTVGLMCISIWGYTDSAARDLAIDRGIAFQLTNILRDYGEDYDHRRVYLPLEDFHRLGLTPADVRAWSPPERCTQFIHEQAARAEEHYRRSAALDRMITPACQPSLWAMTTIYRELLAKICRDPARIVRGSRVRLSPLRKAAIAVQARRLGRTRQRRLVSAAGSAR